MPEPALASNIGLYRSGVTSPERLRYTSVARDHLLDNALESLRGSVGRKSKKHLLFIGPRGIGKTHLLSCIEDAVRYDEALDARVVVARFPEESNRTRSFADFLIGLCGILKDVLEDEPRWAELFDTVRTEEDDARVTDTLVPAIREDNRRRGRTLLVMLENIGEVLSRQIRDGNDVAALRKFLMADNGCLLVATAPMHFDGITDIRQPFYDFFDIQILDSLSFEETVEVIRRNLDWDGRRETLKSLHDMRPRLEALYRMTGGNPRLAMMLYELIAEERVTGVQEQFHVLLDRISPFYQGRLNDLPPGQRAMLECLASMRGEEKTPAAIAARMRTSQQETSSLLKRLSDAQFLRSEQHPRDRRSRLYTIREGFFDIWLAMNLSRGTRQRLPFLVEFFSLFYPDVAVRDRKRVELRERLLEEGSADAQRALDYLSEVGGAGERAAAKFDLAKLSARLGVAEEAASYVLEGAPLAGDGVSRSIARIVENTPPASDYLSEIEEMIAAWEMHRTGELEAFSHRLAKMGQGLTLRTFSETRLAFLRDTLESLDDAKERIAQRLRIAKVLMDLARWKECEEQQRHALAEARDIADARLVAAASDRLAQLLRCTNRFGEAEPLMWRALENDESAFGKKHPIVAMRLNDLAMVLVATNRISDAEPLLRRALENDEVTFGNRHPIVATRLASLAVVLMHINRLEETESLMRRAMKIDLTALGEDHPNIAIHLNNLASLLHGTNRCEEVEPLLRRALEINLAAYGEQHPAVARALGNLAMVLKDTNRHAEAKPLLERALEIELAASGDQHPNVAGHLYSLAKLLEETHRVEEALTLVRRSLDILRTFGRLNGHEHPIFKTVKASYEALQRRMVPGEST